MIQFQVTVRSVLNSDKTEKVILLSMDFVQSYCNTWRLHAPCTEHVSTKWHQHQILQIHPRNLPHHFFHIPAHDFERRRPYPPVTPSLRRRQLHDSHILLQRRLSSSPVSTSLHPFLLVTAITKTQHSPCLQSLSTAANSRILIRCACRNPSSSSPLSSWHHKNPSSLHSYLQTIPSTSICGCTNRPFRSRSRRSRLLPRVLHHQKTNTASSSQSTISTYLSSYFLPCINSIWFTIHPGKGQNPIRSSFILARCLENSISSQLAWLICRSKGNRYSGRPVRSNRICNLWNIESRFRECQDCQTDWYARSRHDHWRCHWCYHQPTRLGCYKVYRRSCKI